MKNLILDVLGEAIDFCDVPSPNIAFQPIEKIGEGILGRFEEKTKTIILSERLNQWHHDQTIITVLHEFRHYLQRIETLIPKHVDEMYWYDKTHQFNIEFDAEQWANSMFEKLSKRKLVYGIFRTPEEIKSHISVTTLHVPENQYDAAINHLSDKKVKYKKDSGVFLPEDDESYHKMWRLLQERGIPVKATF